MANLKTNSQLCEKLIENVKKFVLEKIEKTYDKLGSEIRDNLNGKILNQKASFLM